MSKTPEKEAPQGSILQFFLPDILKTTFWMENLTQRLTQSWLFFKILGYFLRFSKRTGGAPLSPLSPLVVCLWVWLNMCQYPWIYLNILENAWINCSDYTSLLNMPQCSCNNIIIIVTNVIILEFLSAQFVHPGALLPFYLF